ncbi:stalk domain-containing protein [Cohnella sp. GCM10027633]|uniref:stalk domain-containing protein n=1 Tax=unclassified Cohnella TaxID=2636738 RepID=UPI003631C9E6
MKKALIFIIAAVLTFAAAGTASAAGGNVQPVHVSIDGKSVSFESAPSLVGNKMYIDMEQLLETLGFSFEIEEATGIVYASSEDREIQMSAAGDIAIVNGLTAESTGELIEQDGRTLIGLRFIATLAGYSVGWDKPTRTALLASELPTAEERSDLLGVFDRLLLLEAAGDATGLAALFAKDTPVDVKAQQDEWTKLKTKTTIHKKMVESYSADEAVVFVYDETTKVSGKFFPENKAKIRYTLRKAEDGNWKLYDVEPVEMVVTNVPGLFEQAVETIPEADKTAIGKLLEDQAKANNAESIDAYMATMAPSPLNEETRQGLEQMFAAANSVVAVDRWAIVEYDGAGKATLLSTMTADVEASGQKVKVRTTLTSAVEKVDGKWLFSAEPSLTLVQEQL